MKAGSKVMVPAGVNKDLYRTKMCNSYKAGQECKYKDKCFFAHGEKELKQPVSCQKVNLLAKDDDIWV